MNLKSIVFLLLSLMMATSANAQFCEFSGTFKCSGETKEIRTLRVEGETGVILEIGDYLPDYHDLLLKQHSSGRKVWLAIAPDELIGFIRLLDRILTTYNQSLMQGSDEIQLIDNIPYKGLSTCMVANFETENGFYVDGPYSFSLWYMGTNKAFSINQSYKTGDGEIIICDLRFSNPKEISDLRDKLKKLVY